jgi:hypothetical protein
MFKVQSFLKDRMGRAEIRTWNVEHGTLDCGKGRII